MGKTEVIIEHAYQIRCMQAVVKAWKLWAEFHTNICKVEAKAMSTRLLEGQMCVPWAGLLSTSWETPE